MPNAAESDSFVDVEVSPGAGTAARVVVAGAVFVDCNLVVVEKLIFLAFLKSQ